MENPESEDLFAAAPLPIAVLDDVQRVACLRLIRTEGVGPATFRALINHYGGAERALEALPEISRRAGRARPPKIYSRDSASEEIEAARASGVEIVFTIEPGYPAPLAFIEGAPPLLYVRGRLELLNGSIISIVGSRQASAAGIQLARTFAAEFGSKGHTVASGLARGIDGVAHQAALATGTIAVVAGGVDVVYPPEHRDLHEAIAEQGCLISELPLGFKPRAQDFPRRNRIISGISRAVVVIEAAKRSGTLITARMANEQGRDVFAVPGHPLDPRAEGTNQLLKEGAGLAISADDVLEALAGVKPAYGSLAPRPSLSEGDEVALPAGDAGSAGMVPGLNASAISSGVARPARAAYAGFIRSHAASPTSSSGISEAAVTSTVEGGAAIDLVRGALGPAPVSFDDIARATGLAARAVQVAIMELSLGDLLEFHGGQLVSLKLPAR